MTDIMRTYEDIVLTANAYRHAIDVEKEHTEKLENARQTVDRHRATLLDLAERIGTVGPMRAWLGLHGDTETESPVETPDTPSDEFAAELVDDALTMQEAVNMVSDLRALLGRSRFEACLQLVDAW